MNTEKDIFDRIFELPILRAANPMWKKYRELLLYIFFGGLTTVIGVGSYTILVLSGMNALAANVISWFLAVLFAYITNSIWVFQAKAEGIPAKLRQMIEFYGGRVLTLLMEEAVILVFVELLHMNAIGVKIAAQILVLVGNYLISKLYVFRNP